MKKIIALVLALMLAVTCFAACGKKDGDTKKKYTVGICNYVDDASLNQIVDNIKKQLASVAAEKGVAIELSKVEDLPWSRQRYVAWRSEVLLRPKRSNR